MSSDEQDIINGRIVSKYLKAKQELVTLEARLKEIGASMMKVSQALSESKHLAQDLDTLVDALPAAEELKGLIIEFRETMQRKIESDHAMRELGINLTP